MLVIDQTFGRDGFVLNSYLDWSVKDGCDALASEPLRGAHHDDVVLDGESVHVVHHHMVWSRQKGRLAGQWCVLVQDYLQEDAMHLVIRYWKIYLSPVIVLHLLFFHPFF